MSNEHGSRRRIISYPSVTYAVSMVGSEPDAIRVCSELRKHPEHLSICGIYKTNSCYYVSAKIASRSLPRLITQLCEHSDRVFIGYDYHAIIKEHTKQIKSYDIMQK